MVRAQSLGSSPSSAATAPCDLGRLTEPASWGCGEDEMCSFMASVLRTGPDTSKSQGSVSYYYITASSAASVHICPQITGGQLKPLPGFPPPAGESPGSKALRKLSDHDPSTARHVSCIQGRPNISSSQRAHAVSSPPISAFTSLSTWMELPFLAFQIPPRAELSSPALCPTVPLLGHLWL